MLAQKLKIRKIGNSQGLILPGDLLKSLGLKENSEIEAFIEDGLLIICPKKKTLKKMLASVPKGQKFTEASTGLALGKEDDENA